MLQKSDNVDLCCVCVLSFKSFVNWHFLLFRRHRNDNNTMYNVPTTCLLLLIRPEADGFHYEDVRVRVKAVESQKTYPLYSIIYHTVYWLHIVHGTCLNNIGNNIILLLVSEYLRLYNIIHVGQEWTRRRVH